MSIVKVTLLGPAPYGGTVSCVATDPCVAKAYKNGYKVMRVWAVKVEGGRSVSTVRPLP